MTTSREQARGEGNCRGANELARLRGTLLVRTRMLGGVVRVPGNGHPYPIYLLSCTKIFDESRLRRQFLKVDTELLGDDREQFA